MSAEAPRRALDALAARFGVARTYHGVDGTFHAVPDDTLVAILSALGLPAETEAAAAAALAGLEAEAGRRRLPAVIRAPAGEAPALPLPPDADVSSWTWALDCEDGTQLRGTVGRRGGAAVLAGSPDVPAGCQRLVVEGDGAQDESVLIVAPRLAWQIGEGASDGRPRLWGMTAPLYGLRSGPGQDRGIGTYADWGRLAALGARWGAAFAGVNPVHALFPADPARCSPYSPSSRLFHNVLHIAPEHVPGFAECPEAQALWAMDAAAAEALRTSDTVDYPAAASRLFPVLEALFARVRDQPGGGVGAAGKDREPTSALARHALFYALHEHFVARLGPPACWQDWPDAYRRPDSAQVRAFAAAHRERIAFHAWLQRVAGRQLAEAARTASAAGSALGLYADLAVGVARDGADVWANPGQFAQGMALGAPPDAFAPNGQNWALAPFNPRAVRACAYVPVRAMLHAAMRHAGLVRIDHVLGFARAFWIPDGLPGTYVAQPLDELLDIVAIVSRRNRCAVIGEDLGNVPAGLREQLAGRGMLGTRLTWFEREADGRFRSPETYPENACAGLSSHDLPTLRGYWTGADIGWRRSLGRIDEEGEQRERAARRSDRAALLGFAGIDGDADAAEPPAGLAEAVHGRLAEAPSRLVTVQIEDMLGCAEQANMPGTVDGHPNWRRRLPAGMKDLAAHPRAIAVAAAVGAKRSRHLPGSPATKHGRRGRDDPDH